MNRNIWKETIQNETLREKKKMENRKEIKWHGKYNKKNQNMSNSRLERKKIECESVGDVIFEEITTNNL